MANPGVPWRPTKEELLRAIRLEKGNISQAAKRLGVVRQTLWKHISPHDDIMKELHEIRHHFEEYVLDGAEQAMEDIVYQRDDIGATLKAAMYILNNKGKKRGWSLLQGGEDVRGFLQDKVMKEISVLYQGMTRDKEQSPTS